MDCIFCKIVRGEIPSARIYEDEHVVAFLDISPLSPGHALVIPREHAADLFEIGEEALAAVARATARVARQLRAALAPEGINVLQNNGRAAGQVVFHYHVHLIPRAEGDGLLGGWAHKPADAAALQSLAERIRNA